MGAWGIDAFGNDTACDWSYDLEGQSDFSLVERTLERILVLPEEQTIDASSAEEGIAAAEVVARAQGSREVSTSYTEPIDTWISSLAVKPTPALAVKARAVIERLLQGPSELTLLWAETDEGPAWKASVSRLKERISL